MTLLDELGINYFGTPCITFLWSNSRGRVSIFHTQTLYYMRGILLDVNDPNAAQRVFAPSLSVTPGVVDVTYVKLCITRTWLSLVVVMMVILQCCVYDNRHNTEMQT